ncbi:hypothetical protein KDK_37020 [Dictyobacter kobayashii]|uniref:Uncharacterized protein n=1 Tax=Dictyobacter kobayashii TaxID=2014872 RepID=A0A402AL91_9CHLR|nr:hypothetical protein KDK_37020 [Dictyobacter kobayashii]
MYSESKEITATDWWALGDTPVRRDSRVTYFIDGQATFLEMCLCFYACDTLYLPGQLGHGTGYTPGTRRGYTA